MMLKSGKDVVAVLPYGLSDNDRRVGMDLQENVHAHALIIDEAVPPILAVRVRAAQGKPFGPQGFGELLFHLRLSRPADLICRLAQIAAGDQQHFSRGNGCRRFQDRDSIG